jgi:hypothetical protein
MIDHASRLATRLTAPGECHDLLQDGVHAVVPVRRNVLLKVRAYRNTSRLRSGVLCLTDRIEENADIVTTAPRRFQMIPAFCAHSYFDLYRGFAVRIHASRSTLAAAAEQRLSRPVGIAAPRER